MSPLHWSLWGPAAFETTHSRPTRRGGGDQGMLDGCPPSLGMEGCRVLHVAEGANGLVGHGMPRHVLPRNGGEVESPRAHHVGVEVEPVRVVRQLRDGHISSDYVRYPPPGFRAEPGGGPSEVEPRPVGVHWLDTGAEQRARLARPGGIRRPAAVPIGSRG